MAKVSLNVTDSTETCAHKDSVCFIREGRKEGWREGRREGGIEEGRGEGMMEGETERKRGGGRGRVSECTEGRKRVGRERRSPVTFRKCWKATLSVNSKF